MVVQKLNFSTSNSFLQVIPQSQIHTRQNLQDKIALKKSLLFWPRKQQMQKQSSSGSLTIDFFRCHGLCTSSPHIQEVSTSNWCPQLRFQSIFLTEFYALFKPLDTKQSDSILVIGARTCRSLPVLVNKRQSRHCTAGFPHQENKIIHNCKSRVENLCSETNLNIVVENKTYMGSKFPLSNWFPIISLNKPESKLEIKLTLPCSFDQQTSQLVS